MAAQGDSPAVILPARALRGPRRVRSVRRGDPAGPIRSPLRTSPTPGSRDLRRQKRRATPGGAPTQAAAPAGQGRAAHGARAAPVPLGSARGPERRGGAGGGAGRRGGVGGRLRGRGGRHPAGRREACGVGGPGAALPDRRVGRVSARLQRRSPRDRSGASARVHRARGEPVRDPPHGPRPRRGGPGRCHCRGVVAGRDRGGGRGSQPGPAGGAHGDLHRCHAGRLGRGQHRHG